jgi:CTP:molybdopterin cytidylyltransferase MocA
VSRAVIGAVVDAWRAGGGAMVAPSYRGVLAPPVLFGRGSFAELRALTGDAGARSILLRSPERVMHVPVDATPPPDVDTTIALSALEEERQT